MCNIPNNAEFCSQKGVSLVELSIVIAVIGLIMGTVAVGLNVQKSSELRNIITDVNGFNVAIEAFDSKYINLPGDIDNAHDYWGSNCDASNTNCNGDGDGTIDIGSGNDSESFRLWQHLELAGFVQGGFTGSGTGITSVPAVNVPATSRDKGGYHVETYTNDTNTVVGTNIVVGSFLAANPVYNRFLTAAEAFYIDNKTDDGDPDDGDTQARSYRNNIGWQTTCISGTDPNRSFTKTTTTQECIMFFAID